MTYASACEFYNSSLRDALDTIKHIIDCWNKYGLKHFKATFNDGEYYLCQTILTSLNNCEIIGFSLIIAKLGTLAKNEIDL